MKQKLTGRSIRYIIRELKKGKNTKMYQRKSMRRSDMFGDCRQNT